MTLAFFSVSNAVESTAMAHFEKAKEVLKSAPGDNEYGPEVQIAIDELEKAISMDSDFFDAHLLLGNLYNRKRFSFKWDSNEHELWREKSEKQFRIATDILPDNVEALYQLSNVLETGDPEVISILEKIVSIDPTYANAHYSLAAHLEKSRQLEQAADEYLIYIDLKMAQGDYVGPNVFLKLANMLISQNYQEKAVEVINKFIESDNKRAVSVQLSRLDLAKFDEQKYGTFIEKISKLKNFSDKKNIEKAYELLQTGQLTEAMDAFHAQITVNPYATDHYREFAQALENKGYFKEAYEVYEVLLDSNNSIADKCWYLGRVVLRKDFANEDGQLATKLKSICDSKITFIE